jgi:hypothetical protein
MADMLAAAEKGLAHLFDLQQKALGGELDLKPRRKRG